MRRGEVFALTLYWFWSGGDAEEGDRGSEDTIGERASEQQEGEALRLVRASSPARGAAFCLHLFSTARLSISLMPWVVLSLIT